jgi:hypothetical protein
LIPARNVGFGSRCFFEIPASATCLRTVEPSERIVLNGLLASNDRSSVKFPVIRHA